ncbi:hypothetical protein [Amnibacterium endophyticum]|uniref:Uncharacterized protein n=1 Tax=Amnibacterium endophyticum TaxID=2109337 RepID=A0ABW4LH65_9MICO
MVTRLSGVRVIATAGVLLFGLTGCTPSLANRSESAPKGSASTGTAEAEPLESPSGSSSGLHDLEPTRSATAGGVLQIALTAMSQFCRPRLSAARWIAGMDPFLTLEASSVYATVDPARVQCSHVTPPARLVEGDGFTQVVTVQTDRSPYRVTLSRSSLSEPWLVFRIAPSGTR